MRRQRLKKKKTTHTQHFRVIWGFLGCGVVFCGLLWVFLVGWLVGFFCLAENYCFYLSVYVFSYVYVVSSLPFLPYGWYILLSIFSCWTPFLIISSWAIYLYQQCIFFPFRYLKNILCIKFVMLFHLFPVFRKVLPCLSYLHCSFLSLTSQLLLYKALLVVHVDWCR